MRELKFNWNIDFVGGMKLWGGISAAAVLLSLGLMVFKGMNYGIDFSGGTEIQVRFRGPIQAAALRQALDQAEFDSTDVQRFGEAAGNEFLIRVQIEELNISTYEDSLRQGLATAAPGRKVLRLRYAGDNALVTLDGPAEAPKLLAAINGLGLATAKLAAVTRVGKETDNEWQLRFAGAAERIEGALAKAFSPGQYEVRRVDAVGSKVGRDLQHSAILAILVSLFAILVYIGFRFDFNFAPGAVLCLFHDVIVTCGLFVLLNKQFDLTIIAALLTLVGYSINDTIVIFDRIRENLHQMGGRTLAQLVNDSINQTLSRTLLTNFTVLLITVSLLFFGGNAIHDFAFAMTFGVIVGTYSTVFVASPLYLMLENYLQRRRLAA